MPEPNDSLESQPAAGRARDRKRSGQASWKGEKETKPGSTASFGGLSKFEAPRRLNRRNVLLAPLLCVKKILLAHHPPSILHTSQQRSNGRSAIELALQQVQRAGKHSWIQEKNSEREFQRKFFLLIPLSKGKETEKACLHRLLPILRWRQRPYPSYQQLYRD